MKHSAEVMRHQDDKGAEEGSGNTRDRNVNSSSQPKPKHFPATEGKLSIIPGDPLSSSSVLSLRDTYTSCPSPPPPPPASSSLAVPNEAPWECSPAPSSKVDSHAFCCFRGAAGNGSSATRSIWPRRPGDHASGTHTHTHKCKQFSSVHLERVNIYGDTHTNLNQGWEDGQRDTSWTWSVTKKIPLSAL